MCEEGECCGLLSPCCCLSAAVVNPVWETQNAEWCLDGLPRCIGAGRFERTWPKQVHRDQLSAFKSVWPLAKPNEDSARQRGRKQRLIFSADRKQGRKWREMRRLQFSTAERLAGRPACRQNKSLQIGVPAASRHSAYCDECSEGRHLFFLSPPKSDSHHDDHCKMNSHFAGVG